MEENRQNPQIEEHNATLDDDFISGMTEDELQESILEDSGMNSFQKYCARMNDARWALMQRAAGVLLGVGAGLALFWDSLTGTERQQQGFFSLPLIIALALAMFVPNIIEKQSLRKVPKLRLALVIALAAVIVIYFLVLGFRTGFHFTT